MDTKKDQSYVLHMLKEKQLQRLRFPIGGITKSQVREMASSLSLQTAGKADSQDVCFISRTKGGRHRFLEERMVMTPGEVVDLQGKTNCKCACNSDGNYRATEGFRCFRRG